ncbi:hypothetical protein QQP08_020153 [Theobroma cacao]|nr:hypothetical protein QQP08_020153 [Theobroma cacao]
MALRLSQGLSISGEEPKPRRFLTLLFPLGQFLCSLTESSPSSSQAMATQNREMSNGWPLGLQIMTMRLRLQERLQAAAPTVEPYSLHMPSSSFSSFSSSNLDTEDVSRRHNSDMSQGICIPLILGALVKMSRNRSKSKQLDD